MEYTEFIPSQIIDPSTNIIGKLLTEVRLSNWQASFACTIDMRSTKKMDVVLLRTIKFREIKNIRDIYLYRTAICNIFLHAVDAVDKLINVNIYNFPKEIHVVTLYELTDSKNINIIKCSFKFQHSKYYLLNIALEYLKYCCANVINIFDDNKLILVKEIEELISFNWNLFNSTCIQKNGQDLHDCIIKSQKLITSYNELSIKLKKYVYMNIFFCQLNKDIDDIQEHVIIENIIELNNSLNGNSLNGNGNFFEELKKIKNKLYNQCIWNRDAEYIELFEVIDKIINIDMWSENYLYILNKVLLYSGKE
jgi:hypothetical protein